MHLGCFAYSDEEDAASSKLDSKILPEEAALRRDRVMSAQQEISGSILESYIGNTVRVAVEGLTEEGDSAAHAAFQAPVVDGAVIVRGAAEPGTFLDVRITGVSGYDLLAEAT
jgi:ribosomal protein S12 methylthiotransferase